MAAPGAAGSTANLALKVAAVADAAAMASAAQGGSDSTGDPSAPGTPVVAAPDSAGQALAGAAGQTQSPAAAGGATQTSGFTAGQGAQIVSQVAAQLIKRVAGKSTQFDVALDPAGFGRVNVKVQISASGQVSASLSFDNPAAAAEARSRAGDLQQALEQAGFNLAQGGLSFDGGGQGSGLARQDSQPTPNTVAAATIAAAEISEPISTNTSPSSGLDIKI